MDHAELWVRRGFDPHEEILGALGCFTKGAAERSLFDSQRGRPVFVELEAEDESASELASLLVVIDHVRTLFIQEDLGDDRQPNWYFEGEGYRHPRDAVPFCRVRIHVSTMDYTEEFEKDDIFSWQYVKPTDA